MVPESPPVARLDAALCREPKTGGKGRGAGGGTGRLLALVDTVLRNGPAPACTAWVEWLLIIETGPSRESPIMSSRNSISSSTASGSAASAGNPYTGGSSEARSLARPASAQSSWAGPSRRSANTPVASSAPQSVRPGGSNGSGWQPTAAPASHAPTHRTTMVAPQPQSMTGSWARSLRASVPAAAEPSRAGHPASLPSGAGSFRTVTTPPTMQSIPELSSLQPHIEQQLLRDGDIRGTNADGKSEADRRVRELQSRPEIGSVDWCETQANLEDLSSQGKITENTYKHLSDAAMRAHRRNKPRGAQRPTGDGMGTANIQDWAHLLI